MRLLNEAPNIQEATLIKPDRNGWIAKTTTNETVWVKGDTNELIDAQEGDIVITALERHQRYPNPHYHASWAVLKGDVTLDTVESALAHLSDNGPSQATEIGASNADILYHSGKVSKFVLFDRKKYLDPMKDIWYMVDHKNVEVVEYLE